MRTWLIIIAAAIASCSSGGNGTDAKLTWSVAAADFNGDGYNDLAVSRTLATSAPQKSWVEVLLQDSTSPGHYPTSVVYDIDTRVGRITNRDLISVGDINLDGAPDLVTSLEGGSQIAVLLNLGDGTFEPPLPLPTAPLPVNAAIADLNNDGKPDIVVGDTQLSWFPQDPEVSGELLDRQTLADLLGLPLRNSFVTTTDFNTDGRIDIVTANYQLGIMLQAPPLADRPFTVATYNLPDRAFGTVAADFDATGVPDVAVVGGDWLRIYPGSAAVPGTLLQPDQYRACSCGAFPDEDYDCNDSVAAADLNQDSAIDIVVTGSDGYWYDTRSCLIVFLQTAVGSGKFVQGYRWFGPKQLEPWKFVTTADLDGDGLTDIALTGSDGLRLFRQDPATAGNFMQPLLLLEDGDFSGW